MVFSALQAWNGFLFPLVLTQSESTKVVTLGLYNFQTAHGINIPGLLGAVVLSMVPILLVYLFARRALVQGLMGAGGKWLPTWPSRPPPKSPSGTTPPTPSPPESTRLSSPR
ncbi:hypothetical protein SVIOM342S_03763 [Streptomyces violaceorubidus]